MGLQQLESKVSVCEALKEMLVICVGGLVIQPEDGVGGGGGGGEASTMINRADVYVWGGERGFYPEAQTDARHTPDNTMIGPNENLRML